MGVMAHQVILEIVEAPFTAINPGTFIIIKARVTCPMRCNFKADKVRIINHDGKVIKEAPLVIPMGKAFETDPIVLKAPILAGSFTWKACYYEQEKEGITHLETSVPVSFTVKPLHMTGIAIWDVPSPLVAKETMKFKVGVKCSADCRLTGQVIKIYNHKNREVATAKLGDKPWAETQALYWTEVELQAPDQAGSYNWQVKFPVPDSEAPHLETESSFSFRVANPPECTVNVKVMDGKDKTPIQGAAVILHPYKGETDEQGKACFEITKGEYQLYVGGLNSYESRQSKIIIQQSLYMEVELESSNFMGD
ncbi:MAG TPA: carboxypeptidase-like regulatory domain-containing protein [Desulfitobacterium dehalogenans]|uniref:Carboxypeptidase-like regulatory domain-containing protein n=1 Tax=Desulfitobacterium dehalogenans TaxID=36854 RepID=A0A7C7DCD8_9FIRM|nr:carboxypeptidase-like regulatory domain-containing protein [Desulfitobacterium dehalogenans]